MAKYVIAGKADCPFFAKAEMLADELEKILVSFKVHKIVVNPEKWQDWLQETCEERGWKHNASPLVWKELVDRGGKGLFIGGCDDFLEMAEAYYGVRSEKMSEELLEIAKENLSTKQAVEAENEAAAKVINPLRVTITDGASPVSYAVLNSLLSGEIFGHDQDISVTLLDKTDNKDALQGIVMEVQDCAWPLLRDIFSTTETGQAFKNSDVILILDEACPVDETSGTTPASAEVFKQYAEAIESDAKKSTKILVCSQNGNINAAVISNYAPSISKYNICALSRLNENRAKAEVARKLNVNSSGIIDLIIWGNPGNEDYIDISKSHVRGYDGALWAPHIKTFSRPVMEMVHDDNWVSQELLNKANHGLILKGKNKMCPSMSTGAAILDFMKDWWCTSTEYITSLGVISEGWYGVPKDIVFSFPVLFVNGSWQIVDDLEMSDDALVKIKNIGEYLKRQTDEILEKLAAS